MFISYSSASSVIFAVASELPLTAPATPFVSEPEDVNEYAGVKLQPSRIAVGDDSVTA
jgi:hypothetical protein